MKLTFFGATQQVTGSMFLIESDLGLKILVDCGLDFDRHRRKDRKEPTSLFPFKASEIDIVLLTHAHLDHTGRIPNLLKAGFRGKIICTQETYDLVQLLLEDAARLNKSAIDHAERKQKALGFALADPMKSRSLDQRYVLKDVNAILHLMQTSPMNEEQKHVSGLRYKFNTASHLLGAASVVLTVPESSGDKTIAFSGDIGRDNYPLLPAPVAMEQVDYLVCESTYGNRAHKDRGRPEEILEKTIRETCIDKPGRLIIPAFSIGRTQALLYTLNRLYVEGRLPKIKVFADSPLAVRSTEVYEKHINSMNEEAKAFFNEHDSLFDFDNLNHVSDLKTSEEISNYHEPCIIISSSGMLEGGRIQHHIDENLENPFCTIFFIGYSAEGTLGHQLLHGQRRVRSNNGAYINIACNVKSTDVFSGHGDVHDLMAFVNHQDKEKLKKVFIVHGEHKSMLDFQGRLQEDGFKDVIIPEYNDEYEL